MCGDSLRLFPPPTDSFHRLRTVPLPRRGRSGGFAGQGLRPCRRLDIGALRSPLYPFARPLEGLLLTRRGRTGAQCAPLRGTAMQPSVANASNCCNDAAQRCKRISPLRFLPRCRGAHRAPVDIPQTLDFPIPIPPSSREGDRPQAVEGVSRRWKEFAGGGRRKKPRWEGFSSRRGFFVSWAATRGIGGEATNKRMHKRVPMRPACEERKGMGSGYSILYTQSTARARL